LEFTEKNVNYKSIGSRSFSVGPHIPFLTLLLSFLAGLSAASKASSTNATQLHAPARRTTQQEHAISSVQSMPQVWSLDVPGINPYSERARF